MLERFTRWFNKGEDEMLRRNKPLPPLPPDRPKGINKHVRVAVFSDYLHAVMWDGTNDDEVKELVGGAPFTTIRDRGVLIVSDGEGRGTIACKGQYVIVSGSYIASYRAEYIHEYYTPVRTTELRPDEKALV